MAIAPNEMPYSNLARNEARDSEESLAQTVHTQHTQTTFAPPSYHQHENGNNGAAGASSTRAPADAIKVQPFRHELASTSGNMRLVLNSMGTSASEPIYMQHVYPVIEGYASALVDPDTTVVRVQIKGQLASTAGQTSASYNAGEMGGAAFWKVNKVIWKAGDATDSGGRTEEVPFSFRIPEWIEMAMSFGDVKRCPTPPTYVLWAEIVKKKPEILASVRFNIKIIIEKKGMVRRDEKFSVPLTYKMEQQSSSWLPEARRNAFLTGGIIPSPSEDPRLYATHQSRKVVTKSGIFTLKDVDTTIRLELPDPLLYALNERIPYTFSISSPDLKRLGGGYLGLKLIERRWTGSGGLGPGETFETVIASPTSEIDNGRPNDATTKSYKGIITFENASVASFKTPKLEVIHYLLCVLIDNGIMKEDLGMVPITLVNVSKTQ